MNRALVVIITHRHAILFGSLVLCALGILAGRVLDKVAQGALPDNIEVGVIAP